MILMSGPCAIEGREKIRVIARDLQSLNKDENINFYFKASFDKANRTSLENYRGIGVKEGLEILKEIKKEFGYKIITDVHECYQVEIAAEVADIIQIPALLCRQTDLIVEAAKSNKIVNIKKGQFVNPIDMQYAALKVIKTRGGENADYETSKKLKVCLTERGSSFGYGNLVVDMRSLVIMRKFAPVIFDCTHSVQMPGLGGGKSSGDSSFVLPLAKAAAAVGVDGFFMECHNSPKDALSDGANMINSKDVANIMDKLIKISNTSN
ncbi:MAG: 3-deoxy-8-phosphooctulonate synthase [Helicobacteraceae bacterium]|nr:3-deoxy-8-phosphooctulonate synthase [Helicobacteraceae bacterium]